MIAPAIAVWIGRYGYAAVVFGVFLESAAVPVPGETIAFAASFAAARGTLSLPAIIGAVAAGAILGDNVGYFLGRRFGREWLERHGRWVLLSPARLRRLDAFFARFGPAAVTIARFVAGVRVLAAFAAGASRMRWRIFLTYNIVGAVLWATTVCMAGYAVGRGFTQLGARLRQGGVVAALVLIVALIAVWVWRRAHHTRPATFP